MKLLMDLVNVLKWIWEELLDVLIFSGLNILVKIPHHSVTSNIHGGRKTRILVFRDMPKIKASRSSRSKRYHWPITLVRMLIEPSKHLVSPSQKFTTAYTDQSKFLTLYEGLISNQCQPIGQEPMTTAL